MPIAFWSATNNMLENTMTIFVLLSVWLMILSYLKNNKIWLFLAGIALFGAFMSKGFTGLFPLVFPIIYCIFDDKRHWIQGPIDTLLLMITLALLPGAMFLAFPASFAYLKTYFSLQVIGGGLHEATVSTRFYIVFRWLGQMIAPLVIITIVLILSKLNGNAKVFEFRSDKTWFLIFLILGFMGVLPIMVSLKQSGFYMQAALPFFALACGHLTFSKVNALTLKITPDLHKWMRLGSSAILLIGIVLNLCNIGKYGRDEALIEDVKKRIAEADGRTVIEIAPEEFTNWAAHAYFMRYGKISLNPTQPNN
jgi:4-amino-4-deoxy-L-arabinose transferase-like glycosyltransferase